MANDKRTSVNADDYRDNVRRLWDLGACDDVILAYIKGARQEGINPFAGPDALTAAALRLAEAYFQWRAYGRRPGHLYNLAEGVRLAVEVDVAEEAYRALKEKT